MASKGKGQRGYFPQLCRAPLPRAQGPVSPVSFLPVSSECACGEVVAQAGFVLDALTDR